MNPLNHVAIIMDGNGRWGLKHKNSRNAGHKAGLNTVESIIKQSIKNKIKYLTLFAFSTENWKRPKKEINYLFNLLENFLINKINDFHKQNIKLKIIGSKNFSKKLNLLLNLAEKNIISMKNKYLDLFPTKQYNMVAPFIKALEKFINETLKLKNKDNAVIIITHYQRLLDYIIPDYVHVLNEGKIAKSGNKELAHELEERGYDWIK